MFEMFVGGKRKQATHRAVVLSPTSQVVKISRLSKAKFINAPNELRNPVLTLQSRRPDLTVLVADFLSQA
jgi:hypothetical protein